MESDFSLQELAEQLVDNLGAALYFAGVKKDKIQEALEAYEALLDDESFDENAPYGIDEIIETINLLRQKRAELFTK